MTESDAYRKFVQSVIDNVKRNGFPEKRVAFPLERMYEMAEEKGLNFNNVLETLDSIQIAHEKTTEKIIFYPKDRSPARAATPGEGAPGRDPSPFPGLDPSVLQNMDVKEMMAAAQAMMQNMSPEQLEAVKSMYENMSDEERAALIEQAKRMGLF